MRKALENIKTKENLNIDDLTMSQIVLSSGGDIRNAINTLQVCDLNSRYLFLIGEIFWISLTLH